MTVGLFRPSAWANHLVEVAEVRFEALQLPGPVAAIRLTAAPTAPLELRQQEMFAEGRARAAAAPCGPYPSAQQSPGARRRHGGASDPRRPARVGLPLYAAGPERFGGIKEGRYVFCERAAGPPGASMIASPL